MRYQSSSLYTDRPGTAGCQGEGELKHEDAGYECLCPDRRKRGPLPLYHGSCFCRNGLSEPYPLNDFRLRLGGALLILERSHFARTEGFASELCSSTLVSQSVPENHTLTRHSQRPFEIVG